MMLQELYSAQTLGTSKTDAPRIGNETQYIDGKSEDILKDRSTTVIIVKQCFSFLGIYTHSQTHC